MQVQDAANSSQLNTKQTSYVIIKWGIHREK